jgi:putative transposase
LFEPTDACHYVPVLVLLQSFGGKTFNNLEKKMTEDEKMVLATFRFGIIAEFVTGVKLGYGEKRKLLEEKSGRTYQIPLSKRTSISRSSLTQWINDYKKAGYQIEGLRPKFRSDKGAYKKIDSKVRDAIKGIKIQHPNYTLPTIIELLKQQKLISFNEELNVSSLYRFLKRERLSELNTTAEDKRRFEAEFPNEIWQCDVLHGASVKSDGVLKKTYLCAIIDDHSRLIIHAQFYLSENLGALKDCLKQGVQKRGLPQKFYTDNGACYRAINLEQITACLGIALCHSRPYTPQGRGKIERWFRSIRDSFLPLVKEVTKLEDLNEKLDEWVNTYNNKTHGTTKETPYDRYRKNMSCVRPAPARLIEYFRKVEFRKIKKDRTFSLKGSIFEAPVVLIDKRVELKFHEDKLDEIEIFFDNRSFGFAVKLDARANSKVGRDWSLGHEKPAVIVTENNQTPTGQLFQGGEA